MRRLVNPILIILLAFVQKLAAKHIDNNQDSIDKMAAELVDKLVDQLLKTRALQNAELENTTLAKTQLGMIHSTGHTRSLFSVPRSISLIPLHPTPLSLPISRSLLISHAHGEHRSGVDGTERRQLIAGLAAAIAAPNVQGAAVAADNPSEVAQEDALLERLVLEDSIATLAGALESAKRQAANAGQNIQESVSPKVTKEARASAGRAEFELAAKTSELVREIEAATETAVRTEKAAAAAANINKGKAKAEAVEIQSEANAAIEQFQAAAERLKSAKAYATAAAKAIPKIDKQSERSQSAEGKAKSKKDKSAAKAVAVVSAGKAVGAFKEAEDKIKIAVKITNRNLDAKSNLAALQPLDTHLGFFITGLLAWAPLTLALITFKKFAKKFRVSFASDERLLAL